MIEVLKQTLEALKKISMGGDPRWADDVIPALHQAIKELESQEPVLWLVTGITPLFNGEVMSYTFKPTHKNPEWWRIEPLYTHPPQRTWVGLEGEEIRNLWEEATKPDRSTMTMVTSFARAIEAKLKEKNGA